MDNSTPDSDEFDIKLTNGEWAFRVRDDGYRWWVRKLSEKPLNLDDAEYLLVEYKHSDFMCADQIMRTLFRQFQDLSHDVSKLETPSPSIGDCLSGSEA